MRHALAVKERAAGDLVRAALNVNRGRPAASVGQGTRLPLNQPARTSSKASPLGRPQVRTEAGGVGAGIHPADRKVLEGRKGDPRRCANEALVQATARGGDEVSRGVARLGVSGRRVGRKERPWAAGERMF